MQEAGAEFDIKNVGMRAMDSMRLEKSYRLWGTDLNAENTAIEANLQRFIKLNKGDFTGRQALVEQQETGVPYRFCTIEIEADDADSFGNEPIFVNGKVVGRGTSGGFGHYTKKSLMLGYVESEYATVGQDCKVRLLDKMMPARLIAESPYDPESLVLKA